MSALFLLIGISLVVATAFLIAFIWSVRKGQYEDEYTPSVRILLDDDSMAKAGNETHTDKKISDDHRKIPLRQ